MNWLSENLTYSWIIPDNYEENDEKIPHKSRPYNYINSLVYPEL